MPAKLDLIHNKKIPLIEDYHLIGTASDSQELLKSKRMGMETYKHFYLTQKKKNFFEEAFLKSSVGMGSPSLAGMLDIPSLDTDAHTFVLLNGVFDPDLSDYDAKLFDVETEFKTMPNLVDPKRSMLSALNTAYINKPLIITVKEKTQRPVHIIYLTSGSEEVISFPRVAIQFKKKCRSAKLIESLISPKHTKTLCNALAEIDIEKGVDFTHQIYTASDAIIHHSCTVHHRGNGGYTFNITPKKLTHIRIEHDVILGAETNATLHGAGEKFSHFDYDLKVKHFGDNSRSDIFVKIIAENDANAVIRGDIIIPKHIKDVESNQVLKCLLLSKKTHIVLEPLMHVESDQVKADHGSATGPVDAENLFYLKSKGIDPSDAMVLLKQAFLTDFNK